MSYKIVQGDSVGEWVAGKIGGIYSPLESRAMGLERDGKTVAGIIYEDWNGASIVCHLAIEGRINRDFLREIADYAFIRCKVHKVIAPVNSSNAQSERFIQHMGFVEEGRLRDAHPHGDVVLYTLTKQDCRFLGERYGEKRTTAAVA